MTNDDTRWQRIDALLEQALTLPEADRDAWLDEHCGGDEALKREVLELLSFDGEQTGGLRTSIESAAGSLVDDQSDRMIGETVGNYKITGKIADGGMGSVYRAERVDADFEQQVAIKLLPPHQVDPKAAERFAEERRILATLEHPNIARLLDGGMLDNGSPYLVMEHVNGVSIDTYCRDNALGNRDIINIVLRICDAVQFAHRKLVVHRDIKPSNILVDATGTPKLLDFGIAKLLDPGQESAALTRADWRILTPLYASPEQVEGKPITTAVDVYGVGLLLYRLLTGRLPYATSGDRPSDIERAIVSTPAVSPSTAVGSAASESHPEHWARSQQRALKGDLDTILLTALRKEPERRYASVALLADDLERYLEKQPIAARKESFAYVAGKFVQRHRLPLTATATVLTLAVGLIAYYTARLQTERDTAEQTANFLAGLFEAGDPYQKNQDSVTVASLLEEGTENLRNDDSLSPDVRGRLLKTIALVHRNLGHIEQADKMATDALKLLEQDRSANADDIASTLAVLAKVRRSQGRYEEATEFATRMLRIDERLHGPDSIPVAEAMHQLSILAYDVGDYDTMKVWAERSYDIRTALLDDNDMAVATGANNLGLYYWITGDLESARQYYEQSARIQDGQEDRNEANYASLLHNIGLLNYDTGNYAAAAASYQRSLDIRRAASSASDPVLPLTMYSLAIARERLGDFVSAYHLFREQLPLQVAVSGRSTDMVAYAMTGYGMLLERMGEVEDAQTLLDEAITIYDAVQEKDHPDRTAPMIGQAYLAIREGAYQRAEGLLTEAVRIRTANYGADNVRTIRAHIAMARLDYARGSFASARDTLTAALAVAESTFDSGHIVFAELLTWLGRTELASGNGDAAVTALERALAIGRDQFADEHLENVERQLYLADALDLQGDHEQATAMREPAQATRQQILADWKRAFEGIEVSQPE